MNIGSLKFWVKYVSVAFLAVREQSKDGKADTEYLFNDHFLKVVGGGGAHDTTTL